MSENYLKKIEVLSNLISLSKLLETEIKKMSKELSVSYFELNILFYIARQETTQYKIAKKYSVSIQRSHQMVSRFFEKGYITWEERIEKGRTLKKLYICPRLKEELDTINQKITKKFQEKNITYSNWSRLNKALCVVSEKLNSK